jgi:tryptophan halogenase
MKNIVIVGGGSAGWLSAYFLKKKYPNYNVSLIESTKIGILGAGEGATPNLRSLLINDFGFDENEFLQKVNGTKKYGIKFDKWHSDKSHSFVHGFSYEAIESDVYSYHFDARLFAEYLKNKSIEFGITHIDSEILDFTLIDNEIKKIILNSGLQIDSDFVIDCSGFHRILIGKLYNSKWNSYKDELLVNSAIPFFLNETNADVKQKTIAEAMDWGWMWKIPLQNRWGCGYLYNDTMVSDEFIENEIKRLNVDKSIQINKKIKFNAGCYEKVWIQNCVAIGLSSGFLEPLEATSIMTAIFQLKQLPKNIFDYSERINYNRVVFNFNHQSMLFIRHHYNTLRNDSNFWKTYKNKKIPNDLERIYETFNTSETFYDALNLDDVSLAFTKNQYKHIFYNNFLKKQKTIL